MAEKKKTGASIKTPKPIAIPFTTKQETIPFSKKRKSIETNKFEWDKVDKINQEEKGEKKNRLPTITVKMREQTDQSKKRAKGNVKNIAKAIEKSDKIWYLAATSYMQSPNTCIQLGVLR